MNRFATGFIATVITVFAALSVFAQKQVDKPKPRTVPALRMSAAAPVSVLQYVPDDVVIVGAIQPARVINSKGLQGLFAAAKGQDVLEELLQQGLKQTGFNPADVEEIALILDAQTVEHVAKKAKEQAHDGTHLNNLKQVGLAMHNFHDVNRSFPDDDGIDDGNKGNLSWRVHILPYLEQAALYNQFHLDEAWDSDHNKTLIGKMPDVFVSPGAEDPGTTTMHVLTGTGMPFSGDEAVPIAQIHDGTSNTIMTVIAGSDKAEIWTKPGGLEIEVDDPVASLGKTGDRFATVFMDGSARFLNSDMNPVDLLHLMQHQDGQAVNSINEPDGPGVQPSIAVRCSAAIDQQTVLQKLFPFAEVDRSVMIEGRATNSFRGMFVAFPNPQTMLVGSETSLKAMLGKRTQSGETKAQFEKLYPANDIALAANMEPLQEHLQKMTVGIPMAGLVQNLKQVHLTIDFSSPGESLNHADLVMGDEQSAQQLAAMATGLYQMQKAQVMAFASAENSPVSAELSDILATMMDSTVIKADGLNVVVDTPKPENAGEFLKQLEPAFAELLKGVRAGREVANRSQKLNQLKQLALSLHNYYDVYNGLPSFNTGRSDGGTNKGLSWRVHVLPYLDESALYSEFHLDEPWDSEHNKTLIERMPHIFACEGVDKPGYTAYHVFTGSETPMGGEKPLAFRDITDGLSNTIMVVQAGPDTADVWTKPSGLEFDAEDPKKSLGKIGEQFMVVLCDGSARFISRNIDNETLSNLIQHADGNPIGDF